MNWQETLHHEEHEGHEGFSVGRKIFRLYFVLFVNLRGE
jgi:hypothetical protein